MHPSQATRVLGQSRRLDPAATSPAEEQADEEQRSVEERAAEREEYWSASFDDDGMYAGSFRLSPVRGELLRQAVEAMRTSGERSRDADEPVGADTRPRVSTPEAVERMATTTLDEAELAGVRAPAGERFVVQVTIDVAVLARIAGIALDPMVPTPVRLGDRCHIVGGPTLTDAQVAQVLCDASVQVLVEDCGVPLWLSNETRTATRYQRRALRTRSGSCQFPGCRQLRHVQAHHVVFHGHNGSSGLDNFVLLCSSHHHRLHERLFSITSLGGQRFEFRDQWGKPVGASRLELVDDAPDPPPGVGPDTPRSIGRGEPLTEFGLDVLLHGLLQLAADGDRASPIAA